MSFLRSFNDLPSVRECLTEYGAVGVTDVLTPEESESLVSDITSLVTSGQHDDPCEEAMESITLPMNAYGTIGKGDLYSRGLFQARTHPNVITTLTSVYGCSRPDLFMTQGRVAWMRPTSVQPGYRTPSHWPEVHLDINPKVFDTEGPLMVFGVLNLIDNREIDGGFHFIPYSHTRLTDWQSENREDLPDENRYIFQPFGRDMDPDLGVCDGPVRIPCPPGTLILFDVRTVHGAAPNYSDRSRMITYIRGFTRESMSHPNADMMTFNGDLGSTRSEWRKYMGSEPFPDVFEVS